MHKLHRYLSDQAFYPILTISLYAVGLYLARALRTGSYVIYSNLPWNLFLAWVPYLASMLSEGLHRLAPRRPWLQPLPMAAWLLFYPNAAYLLTDFFHLVPRPKVPFWYDTLLLVAFSWSGLFLAMVSLRTMQRVAEHYLGKWIAWLFAMCVLGISGVGIYLGRFERWNSWDMLFSPKRILQDLMLPMTDPLGYAGFFGFSILFSIFLLLCYWIFLAVDTPDKPPSGRP